jgi:IS605 OrfB family transposase
MPPRTTISLRLRKLLELQDSTLRRFGNWLIRARSNATEHLPIKEELMSLVFSHSVLLLLLIQKSPKFKDKILSMLGSLQESKWTTFLDRLNSSDNHNILAIELLRTLLQESISREKVFLPFWTPVCKERSERLLLPIGTDFAGLDSNSSNNWCKRQVARSSCLTTTIIEQVNKSLQTTSWPSSTSSLVSKWEKEVMPIAKLKTIKFRIYPTKQQKEMLDHFLDISRYVYNNTLEHIKKGHTSNFKQLRDILVTCQTKKQTQECQNKEKEIKELYKKLKNDKDNEDLKEELQQLKLKKKEDMSKNSFQRNEGVKDFELSVPKDVRACAVKRCCDALKTGFTNLRNGNIRHFNMKFKKKTEEYQSFEITPKLFKVVEDGFKIAPTFFKGMDTLKVHKRTKKKLIGLNVSNNTDIVRSCHGYYVHLLVNTTISKTEKLEKMAGVDPGVRSLATVQAYNIETGYTEVLEYKHNQKLMQKLNKKLKLLRGRRNKRVRKRAYLKIEEKKASIVNRAHWTMINDLLSRVDVVYFGDIKSHDIVRGKKVFKCLKQNFNDLKFYQLKQRIAYKAGLCGKKVILVPEHNTTKTCSRCGCLNDVGNSEVYNCKECKIITGRDMNASRNMILKGLL